jgi:acetone carboxylase beta subunit
MGQQPNKHSGPKLQLCYTDTGGTFTDTFLVDEEGNFFLGKSSTTPDDLSIGYFNSIETTLEGTGRKLGELCASLLVAGYGSTTTINTILTRTGARVGLIITKGFEQLFMVERAAQTWTETTINDRIQARTHRHLDPLVPLSLIKGVTERIDCFGNEVIPLYEHEVSQAAEKLLARGVETIAICFLFSMLNPSHERRAAEIVRKICQQQSKEIPVFLRVDVAPSLRELQSINSTVINAYAEPKFRKGLGSIADRLKSEGFQGSLQVMQSFGGLASLEEVKTVETTESGPVGGLIGTQYIGRVYGLENLIGTDVGGTSFDVGIVTKGFISIKREPVCARMLLSIPMAEVNSIGAGGGTLARLDPLTGRLLVGPESAGAVPGPVSYDLGGTIPTVSDADLVMGYIDPDYFLGGALKLNQAKAAQAIKKQIADPLGLKLEEAAFGIKTIADNRMRDAVQGLIMGRGMDISDYTVLAFGGNGPSHVAGYTEGLPVKGIVTFPYASVFSAFGASVADYEHHISTAANILIPPNADNDNKVEVGGKITGLWEDMRKKALALMESEGFSRKEVIFRNLAMVRYGRQLDDLIVNSPLSRIDKAQDLDALITTFEDMYESIYAKAAKYPQAGYEILEVGVTAQVPKIKPKLIKHPLTGEQPPVSAKKGNRLCYFREGWTDTTIYQWESLEAGNRIQGPAILEHATTTLVVPPQKMVYVDEYLNIWLS